MALGADPAMYDRCVPGLSDRGPGSHVDEAVFERVADELRAGAAAQLLLDVRAVRLDGAGGQEELLRDLAVGVAERDQAQHLELALGEVAWRAGRLGGGGHARAEARVEVRVPGGGE